MRIRKTAVEGQFYPSNPTELQHAIEHFNEILDVNPSLWQLRSRAVIVPHAGYIYSGFTANIAFRLLALQKISRVIVIGPSHRVYLKGISIAAYDRYHTPLGELQMNQNIIATVKEKFGLVHIPDAHHEHSTEVQFPMIQYYMPEVEVAELVYGDEEPKRVAEIIEVLLKDPKNGIVISTDLSHFYDLSQANRLDRKCIDAVERLDTKALHHGCEACGKIGVEAMIIIAQKMGLKPKILDYRTSADASKDTSRVVGYMSAAFTEES
ncbi:MAG TPA: AmmeMemoRadiSam system protein B [Epsilonproteobacteria bacterium]|nr:AmmeMemoRadiSam system protein B [Campylobacterota bacterium]